MTITYLAGKRIEGLSTDTKPTPALTTVNAIFTETDTLEQFVNTGSAWSRLQRRQGEPDYIVSVSGANYYVLDTATGITTTNTSIRVLIDTIADVLCTSPRVGGRILFKKGTYLPSARFDIPNTDTLTTPTTTHAIDNCWIEIQGEDRDQTIIKMTVDNNHIFQPRCNFIIRDITLDGNLQSANGITSNYKIRFEAHNIVVRKCGKGDPAAGGWNGFGIWLGNDITGGDFTNGVKSFIIDKCRFYEQNSIQEDVCPTATEFGIVTRCYFDRTWADTQGWKGSQLTGGSGQQVIYTNNIFTRPAGNELSVTRELNGDVKNNIISDNVIKNGRLMVGFSGMGLDVVRTRNIKITDNVMPGGRIQIRGPDTSQSGAAITDPAVWRQIIRDVVIENNVVTDSYFNSIHLFRCEDIIVRNNYIKNSNVGALASTHADAGLIKVENTYNCEIKDNNLYMDSANTGYAIRYSGATDLKIENNIIRNATAQPSLIDAGTNVKITKLGEMGYIPKAATRKYGTYNIYSGSPPFTSNAGTGPLLQRFQSDVVGTGTLAAPGVVTGKMVRGLSSGATINSIMSLRYTLAGFRRETYSKLSAEFNLSSATAVRFAILFTSSTSAPVSSADPLANLTGIGFWLDSAVSARIKSIRNTGAASSTTADAWAINAETTALHTISIYGDEANARWVLEYDSKPVAYTTTIPTTTAMAFWCYIENTAAADKVLNIASLEIETN